MGGNLAVAALLVREHDCPRGEGERADGGRVQVGVPGATWSCHAVMNRWNSGGRALETRQVVEREILWGG